ncbi:MAG: serine/threonine-protein phosphatase, partial [Bacteroidia bacterium]|nr:serine/threonine-protein phosphatase [Bacteroidia bacterium]
YISINEHESVICMADVSGKGMAAALLMSNFQANLRVMLKYSHSLKDVVTELNKTVSKSAKGEKFITFFIAKVNSHSQKITYINAGHNHPFLFNDNKFTLLDKGTVGLGMFDDLPFIRQGEEDFTPGSLLLCYTDGVVELENPNGEDFGIESLMELVKKYQEVFTMKDLHMVLMDAFDQFRAGVPYPDDLTLMSLKLIDN